MLDQHPDGDLVRQPDVRSGQPAIGDLAPQDLEVLGHPGGRAGPGTRGWRRIARARGARRSPRGRTGRSPGCAAAGTRRSGRAATACTTSARPGRAWSSGPGRAAAACCRRRPAPGSATATAASAAEGRRCRPGTVIASCSPSSIMAREPNHRRPFVDQPAPGWIPVALRPRQPDPVAVARHVQGVRAADVGDPGTLRRRPDDPGPARQPPPSSDRQVDLGTPPEYQMTAFGEPDDLARRGTHMRGHKITI